MQFIVRLDGGHEGRERKTRINLILLSFSLALVLLNEVTPAFFWGMDFVFNHCPLGSSHLDGIVSEATYYLLIIIL